MQTNILDHIEQTLIPLNLEVYNMTRGEGKPPCIIVNTSLINSTYSDNEIESEEYLINFNMQIYSDIESKKVDIAKLLRTNRYSEIRVLPSIILEGNIFDIPVRAKKIINMKEGI